MLLTATKIIQIFLFSFPLPQFSLSHYCQVLVVAFHFLITEDSNTAKDIADEPLYTAKEKHVVKQTLSCSANPY